MNKMNWKYNGKFGVFISKHYVFLRDTATHFEFRVHRQLRCWNVCVKFPGQDHYKAISGGDCSSVDNCKRACGRVNSQMLDNKYRAFTKELERFNALERSKAHGQA